MRYPDGFRAGPVDDVQVSIDRPLKGLLDEGVSALAGTLAEFAVPDLDALAAKAVQVNRRDLEGYKVTSRRRTTSHGERAIEVLGTTSPRHHLFVFRTCYLVKGGIGYELTYFHPAHMGNEGMLAYIVEHVELTRSPPRQ